MLSTTLQSLVRDGLATRRVESTVPPAVHYGLTELGYMPQSAVRSGPPTRRTSWSPKC
ncbi:winged helix-turn-helix transcriptional regulator [Streptomyces sp. Amel2xB2]|uniref:winged helix-turn-helix transcriptional regulator n=1 Tax=Streptomyces sp. Amel2xB2 TaxID=1305829 RepID=UPI000DB9E036